MQQSASIEEQRAMKAGDKADSAELKVALTKSDVKQDMVAKIEADKTIADDDGQSASDLASMRVNIILLQKWGMWRTVTSPEKYVDKLYPSDPFLNQIFDYFLPTGEHRGAHPLHTWTWQPGGSATTAWPGHEDDDDPCGGPSAHLDEVERDFQVGDVITD